MEIRGPDGYREIECGSVALACGGFEANAEMRARYLGPGWELAKVRGTRFNTGDGIRMALDIGAQSFGHWSGCHAVAWDLNAPPTGDRNIADLFQKHSYPFGIVVNVNGERFVDEGADFRNYTYAKYGREILFQPQRAAFQIFDQTTVHLLRDEYHIPQVSRVESDTIDGLADGLGVDRDGLVRTVREFNAAVQSGDYNPTELDGKGTDGDRSSEVELGAADRLAAVSRIRGDLRDHVHVRRPEDRPGGPSPGHGGRAHSGAVCRRRAGRRTVLPQLPRRLRPDGGVCIREAGGRVGGRLCGWLRFVAADFNLIFTHASLRQVVGSLPSQPEVGAGPPGLLKANSHLRRNGCMAVQHSRKCVPSHSQRLRGFSDAQAKRIQAVLLDAASGMWWIFHRHIIFPLVIVDEIDIVHVAIVKAECDPPVAGD